TFEFNSKQPDNAHQHTINGIQFGDQNASVDVVLGAVEEWKVVNSTIELANGTIDHPLHIHINPFQVTEMFDPHERFIDETSGNLVDRYVFDQNSTLLNGQCRIIPAMTPHGSRAATRSKVTGGMCLRFPPE